MYCAERVGEREIYEMPFTTVRPMPSNTDEEIAVLIADRTQPDEAWSWTNCSGIG